MPLLSEHIWDEWLAVPVENSADAEAECSGVVFGTRMRTNRPWVARRLVTKLWNRTSWAKYGSAELSVSRARNKFISLIFPCEPPLTKPEGKSLWPWLRGMFGGCGSLYLPRTSYYLAFRAPVGDNFGDVLARTGLGWKKRTAANGNPMPGVYLLRNQEDIVTFLCNIGLNGMALKLEDRAMMRGARENANRVSNCDTANIRRTVAAAREQLRLASKLANDGVLPHLPPALRALVEARLANPEASLSEIGEKLSPPIRKSTVKYRWARLSGYVNRK